MLKFTTTGDGVEVSIATKDGSRRFTFIPKGFAFESNTCPYADVSFYLGNTDSSVSLSFGFKCGRIDSEGDKELIKIIDDLNAALIYASIGLDHRNVYEFPEGYAG